MSYWRIVLPGLIVLAVMLRATGAVTSTVHAAQCAYALALVALLVDRARR
jgi:hypothetical protein